MEVENAKCDCFITYPILCLLGATLRVSAPEGQALDLEHSAC